MRGFKVAMVAACPFPANHGSPASIREMSMALAGLGHEIHVVTYPMQQEIPVDGFKIHRVAKLWRNNKVMVGPSYQRPFYDLLLVQKLYQVIRREGIDIIHAHNYEGAIAGAIAKKLTGKPLLYNAVNTMSDELPAYGFIRPQSLAVKVAHLLDQWVPRAGDHVTVVSRELLAFLCQRGIPPERMTVVPAGVNPEMFEGNDPTLMRHRHGLGSRPLVIYTGTLDAFQRIDYLLKAMTVVVNLIPEARLLVVGNIVEKARLKACLDLARELGIDSEALFTDARPLAELPAYLAAADVAVLPRPSCPGHPVKLLNYMAAGRAIVAFQGAAKGLRHMHNAIVIPDHDWEGLGQGILMLLKDPPLAKALGENARKSILGTFDWCSLAKRISAIYAALISRT